MEYETIYRNQHKINNETLQYKTQNNTIKKYRKITH